MSRIAARPKNSLPGESSIAAHAFISSWVTGRSPTARRLLRRLANAQTAIPYVFFAEAQARTTAPVAAGSGAQRKCYPQDVTKAEIDAYRAQHR
jgi:hypothetical protein